MNGELIISLIAMILAISGFISSFSFPGGTSDGVPGAGFFPQVLCAVIFVLSLIVAFNAAKNIKKYEKISSTQKKNLKVMGYIIISTIFFIAAWGHIHFIIICSVYLILLGIILKQKLKYYIPSAVGASFTIFFIFKNLLNVMLNN